MAGHSRGAKLAALHFAVSLAARAGRAHGGAPALPAPAHPYAVRGAFLMDPGEEGRQTAERGFEGLWLAALRVSSAVGAARLSEGPDGEREPQGLRAGRAHEPLAPSRFQRRAACHLVPTPLSPLGRVA